MGFWDRVFGNNKTETKKELQRPRGKATRVTPVQTNMSTFNDNSGIFGMGPVMDIAILSSMSDSSSDSHTNCHSHDSGSSHCHDSHSDNSSYDSGSYDSGSSDSGSSGGDY